jgi:hypothetical protein
LVFGSLSLSLSSPPSLVAPTTILEEEEEEKKMGNAAKTQEEIASTLYHSQKHNHSQIQYKLSSQLQTS